jgi:hypothetical protein
LHRKCDKRKTFVTVATIGKKHLTPSDFKPLFNYLLESHPGLEFLKATPEF